MKKFLVSALAVSLFFTCSGMSDLPTIFVGQNNNNETENPADQDLPTLPDYQEEEESSFSKAVNSLLQASELKTDQMSLTILFNNSADSLVLTIKDLDLDLSQINTLSLGLSCSMSLNFNGLIVDIERFVITHDDSLYLTYKGKSFSFSAPVNFADLMDVFKNLGLISADSSSSLDINLSLIINKVKEVLAGAYSVESTTESGHNFTLTIPSIDINDNTSLNSFTLEMNSDTSDNVTYLGTKASDPLIISSKNSDGTYSSLCNISFDMPLTVKDSSSYVSNLEEAVDTTDAHGALLSTISKIFIQNGSSDYVYDLKTQVGIDVSLVNTNSNTNLSLSGDMKIDASDVFHDFSNSKVEVNLDHLSGEEVFNTLSAYYTGGDQGTTYLKLNDNFKAKIENSELNDLFSYVSSATCKQAIEVITTRLGTSLASLDFDSFTNFDFSSLNGFIKSLDYDTSSMTYTLLLDGSCLLSDLSDVTLELVLDANREIDNVTNPDYGLKSINIKNLSISGYTIDLGLSLQDMESFTAINYDDYLPYHNTLSLFETLANLVAKEKMAVTYDLVYNDEINGGSYNAIGEIGVDITNVSSLKSFYKKENGEYVDDLSKANCYLSLNLNTGPETLAHGFNMKYYDKDLYMDYSTVERNSDGSSITETTHSVLKNKVLDTQLGAFIDYLDSNTSTGGDTSASSSLFDMNSILSSIGCSTAFIEATKAISNGDLSSLDQYFSQTHSVDENNVETLTLTLIEDNLTPTFSLKLVGDSNSYELSELVILGERINTGSDLSLILKFKDYDDTIITNNNPDDYQEISKANQILQSFYTLPNRLDSFAIQITGDVNIESTSKETGTTDTTNISLSDVNSGNPSGLYLNMEDKEHPLVRGNLYLTHPTLTDGNFNYSQKIEFEYLTKDSTTNTALEDPQIIAEYNNNMHILLHQSTLSDVVGQIKNLRRDQYLVKEETGEYTNLLMRYLSATNQAANGLPITSLISGNYSSLLSNTYIKKIDFVDSDNRIDLVLDPTLFSGSAIENEGQTTTLSIYYDTTGDTPTLTKVTMNSTYSSESDSSNKTTSINVSLALMDDNDTNKTYIDSLKNLDITAYNDSTSSQFVNMNGLATLTRCLINTTENNYFEFKGSLNIPIKFLAWELEEVGTNVTAMIFVQDNTAYADIICKNGTANFRGDGHYHVSEFFIKEKEVWIIQTQSYTYTGSWWRTYYKIEYIVIKTTSDVIVDNLVYWLLDFVLNIDSITIAGIGVGNMILEEIYSSMAESGSDSNVIKSDDFSKVITTMEMNETNGTLTLTLDLNSILSLPVISFDDDNPIQIVINFDPTTNIFTSFSISGGITGLAGTLDITIETCSFTFTQKTVTAASDTYSGGILTRYDYYVDLIEKENLSLYVITSLNGDGMSDNGAQKTAYREQRNSYLEADSVFYISY